MQQLPHCAQADSSSDALPAVLGRGGTPRRKLPGETFFNRASSCTECNKNQHNAHLLLQ